MATKTRLEKAINGLTELVARHNKQEQIKISKDTIIIANNSSQFWGTIFYLTLIVLLPAGLLVYYLISDKTNSTIVWLLLLELIFVYQLYKMLLGDTVLIINIQEKYFQADNINGVFKRFFTSKKISFSEITKVELNEKSVSSKGGAIRWLQLSVFDKELHKIALTDFNNNYPESFIAEKVKFLIDVIIWTEKRINVYEV